MALSVGRSEMGRREANTQSLTSPLLLWVMGYYHCGLQVMMETCRVVLSAETQGRRAAFSCPMLRLFRGWASWCSASALCTDRGHASRRGSGQTRTTTGMSGGFRQLLLQPPLALLRPIVISRSVPHISSLL